MQKNKNRKIKTGLLIFASLAFGWALSAGPASAAPGLSIDVQRINSTTPYTEWHGESVGKTVGEVNFYTTSNNLAANFGEIINPAGGDNYPTTFKAKGAIQIPAGNYALKLDTYNGGSNVISIYGNEKTICKTYSWIYNNANPCSTAHSFSAGWYEIDIHYEPNVWNRDPKIRLVWSSDGGSTWLKVPEDKLDSSNWDGTEISIPLSGKKQIDYKIAGIGVDDSDTNGGVKELEFQLPDGITAADILPGGVQLFWRNAVSETLKVKNAGYPSGSAINLTGERLKTAKGATLEGLTAKLPDNFFNNSKGNQNIYLSFQNLDVDTNGDTWPDFDGGIAVVVVYKDLTKPNGVLKIIKLGEGVHSSASHPVSFNVSSMDPTTLRPFFLFSDAQSKTLLSEGTGLPRHNYLAMKASASQPGESELFMKGITTAAGETSNSALKRIIPRADGVPSLASTNAWYPMFGREGPEVDVLSIAGNYAPNLRYSGYVSADKKSDGVFDMPPGNNWVSFQYASSDFYGDGSAELGSNESSFFFATGLMYYDAAKLLVCPNSVSLGKNQEQQFTAYYWDSKFGDLPSCAEAEADTTKNNVTDAATWSKDAPDTEFKFIGSGKGKIKAVAATTTSRHVSAIYEGITSSTNVTVKPDSCVYYSCGADNFCKTNIVTGTSDCPEDSGKCPSADNKCNSSGNTNVRWEEVSP